MESLNSEKLISVGNGALNQDPIPENTYSLSSIPYHEYPRQIQRPKDGAPIGIIGRWKAMNSRCYSSLDKSYCNYGGRGILVCDAWHRLNPSGRKNYFEWILGELNKTDLAINDSFDVDRRDNCKGYSPSNCRLISRTDNLQNTRQTKLMFNLVAQLRGSLKLIPRSQRAGELARLSIKFDCDERTLRSAVEGGSWRNVDSIELPVAIGDGKIGKSRQIFDVDVIDWRDRCRSLPPDQRPFEVRKIAGAVGFTLSYVRGHITGRLSKHLNSSCPPVLARDPYDGTNLPLKLYANEGIAQLMFHLGDRECETSYKDRAGKYQGQTGVVNARV